MARQNIYLLCRLPDLESFGSTPPVSIQALLSLVAESEGPVELVQTLLLCDDLMDNST